MRTKSIGITKPEVTAPLRAKMDTVHEVFGRGPDDVLSPMNTATEVLDWLMELFILTGQLAKEDKPGNCQRIAKITELGKYLACDFSNYVGYEKEQMEDALSATREIWGQHAHKSEAPAA